MWIGFSEFQKYLTDVDMSELVNRSLQCDEGKMDSPDDYDLRSCTLKIQ